VCAKLSKMTCIKTRHRSNYDWMLFLKSPRACKRSEVNTYDQLFNSKQGKLILQMKTVTNYRKLLMIYRKNLKKWINMK